MKMTSHQSGFACGDSNLTYKKDVDPNTSHVNGFSLLCVCMWHFKSEFVQNADAQTSQENGFSSECVCMCLFEL